MFFYSWCKPYLVELLLKRKARGTATKCWLWIPTQLQIKLRQRGLGRTAPSKYGRTVFWAKAPAAERML